MKLYQDTNLAHISNMFKQNNETYTNKIDIANEFIHIVTETKNKKILLKAYHVQLQIILQNFSKTRIKMASDLQKYKRNPYHK